MSNLEGLLAYRSATAEQKLAVILSEMVRPVAVIEGYASLAKQTLSTSELQDAGDLEEWIGKILEAIKDLRELRNILFPSPKSDVDF